MFLCELISSSTTHKSHTHKNTFIPLTKALDYIGPANGKQSRLHRHSTLESITEYHKLQLKRLIKF